MTGELRHTNKQQANSVHFICRPFRFSAVKKEEAITVKHSIDRFYSLIASSNISLSKSYYVINSSSNHLVISYNYTLALNFLRKFTHNTHTNFSWLRSPFLIPLPSRSLSRSRGVSLWLFVIALSLWMQFAQLPCSIKNTLHALRRKRENLNDRARPKDDLVR